MNVFKNAFIAFFIAFFSFIALVSCGGEEPKTDNEPTDEEVITDTEPTDDVEPVDNEEPDDIETDDPEIDEEPTDNDTASPSCEENPTCQEVCKNFLEMEGNWSIVIPTTVSGEITLTLSVAGANCKVTVTGEWEFVWEGTEIPQMTCAQCMNCTSFFSLQEMEEELLVIKKAGSKENCEAGEGGFWKFKKIQ